MFRVVKIERQRTLRMPPYIPRSGGFKSTILSHEKCIFFNDFLIMNIREESFKKKKEIRVKLMKL